MKMTEPIAPAKPPFPQIPGLNLEAFLNFAIDPNRTEEIFKVQGSLLQAPNRSEMVHCTSTAIAANPEFMSLYKKRAFPVLPSLQELGAMPAGSLGWSLHKHLVENQINLNFEGLDTDVFRKSIDTTLGFLGVRGIVHHDTYHAILGLGTQPVDEFALFAFQLGQFHSPYHLISLATGLLHFAFYDPRNMPLLMKKITTYYEMGERAAFFPGIYFEDVWTTPLSELRKRWNVRVI